MRSAICTAGPIITTTAPFQAPIEHQDTRSHYRGALRVWAEAALQNDGYRPAAHHLYLISELEKLAAGEFDRLMILMPPGSAESTYTSLLFPVWWFLRHPRSTVICASHSLGLARSFGRRALIGDRAWSALYQQQPQAPGGSVFDIRLIAETDAIEPGNNVVRGWDFAATVKDDGNEPDWTVGVKLCRTGDRRWVVLDVVRIRGSALEVEDLLLKTAARDGRTVTIALPQDPGQAGKFQASWFTGRLRGFHVVSSRESGPKTVRAQFVASQVSAGHVAVVRAPWNRAFLEELRDFPNGSKDDQADALARAFNTLESRPVAAARGQVSHMVR